MSSMCQVVFRSCWLFCVPRPIADFADPDSFSRLEHWHVLRRKDGECFLELVVREADLFHELQLGLMRSRARTDMMEGPGLSTSTPTSPTAAAAAASPSSAKDHVTKEEAGDSSEPLSEPEHVAPLPRPSSVGFFEDELRGYRVLKAAGLEQWPDDADSHFDLQRCCI